MPRKKSPWPAYSYHVSGQAVVRLDYKDFYLGKHGTPESYARYHALLAEYNANSRKAPGDVPQRQEDTAILVKHITADFRARRLSKYEKKGNQAQYNRFGNLLTLLDAKCGDEPAEDFGPVKLEALRDHILKKGIGKKGSWCK